MLSTHFSTTTMAPQQTTRRRSSFLISAAPSLLTRLYSPATTAVERGNHRAPIPVPRVKAVHFANAERLGVLSHMTVNDLTLREGKQCYNEQFSRRFEYFFLFCCLIRLFNSS